MSRIANPELESRLVVPTVGGRVGKLGSGRRMEMTVNGLLGEEDQSDLKLTVVVLAQLCEYIKNEF